MSRETKPHIGIYGRCNSGKSTLLNFITGADVALVSPESGTTTDPVRKSYEILNFAPVIFIDTAGIDDHSPLATLRIKRTMETLAMIDLAIVVFRDWGAEEDKLKRILEREDTPCIIVQNGNSDCTPLLPVIKSNDRDSILEAIKNTLPENSYRMPSLFADKVSPGEIVLLVCPIDSEAPSGRLILPQVQALRDLLDNNAIAMVVQPPQIKDIFQIGITPKIVVTDSQAFAEVSAAVPEGIEITSFSIMLARLKGDYKLYEKGLEAINSLKNGDKVLMLENCLHQTSCEDIGRVKIPALLKKHTTAKLSFDIVSGLSPLPENIAEYALIVQCGGCMVTRSQLMNRIRAVSRSGVPITNYGMCLKKICI